MYVYILFFLVVMKIIYCYLIYIIFFWVFDINLNKIVNYISGCIYYLGLVLVCI